MKAGQLAASIRALASHMSMQTDVSATERQHLCVGATAVPVLDAYCSQRHDLATLMNPFGDTPPTGGISAVSLPTEFHSPGNDRNQTGVCAIVDELV